MGLSMNGSEPRMDRAYLLQVQVLIWDRSLYDPEKGEYTVGRFLNETEQRLGKIDAVAPLARLPKSRSPMLAISLISYRIFLAGWPRSPPPY